MIQLLPYIYDINIDIDIDINDDIYIYNIFTFFTPP